MFVFAWVLLFLEVMLSGASWGMVALWMSKGFCDVGEYDIFFGLFVASLVIGISSIAFAWGSQAKILAVLMLFVLFGIIMLWVNHGHLVVTACPIF